MRLNLSAKFNPEIIRSLRTTLPPRRALFISALTIALVLVLSAIFWNTETNKSYLSVADQMRAFGRDLYNMLTVALFALLFVLAPATAALSFIQEKIRGTAIFQQMMLIDSFDVAAGKFVGSGLLGYFVAALVFPFFLFASVVGGANASEVARICLLLLVGGLCCQSVALFISSALSGPSDRFLRGGLLIGPAVGGLGAISAFILYKNFVERPYYSSYEPWRFYGAELSSYVAIPGLLLFIGVWAFAATVRRIKVGQLIPVRPWPVWLFFASAEAVLTGLFWGGYRYVNGVQIYTPPPSSRLIAYLLLNWGAFVVLAGSSAVGRARLREWWSGGLDPLNLFQREEIVNSLKTFLVALGVSLAGLVALWTSSHAGVPAVYEPNIPSGLQFVAIALCFTLTVAAMSAFIQYSAMQRFRIGAWAGVALSIIFYLVVGVVGASFENRNNTLALLNPLVYTDYITKGDPYLDQIDYPSLGYFQHEQETNVALLHGLMAEGLLAAGCFGLAYSKWRKTADEMIEEND